MLSPVLYLYLLFYSYLYSAGDIPDDDDDDNITDISVHSSKEQYQIKQVYSLRITIIHCSVL